MLFTWKNVCMYFMVSILGTDVCAEHVNHAIAVLDQGKPAFGVFSESRSSSSARSISQSDLDYVIIDMEHAPYDIETLQNYIISMADKAAIAKSGSVMLNTTPIVRIPANGREMNQYMVKQVLDAGAFGIMFPMIDTPEQATSAIAAMRYPPLPFQSSELSEPRGVRGRAPATAAWIWGVDMLRYIQTADVWPLNPAGDLLAVLQIETLEGVRNIDEIIQVPGVGAIFIGPSDLSADMGKFPNHEEVEAEIQKVLAACIAHGVPCGITTTPEDIASRVEQGFRFATAGYNDFGLPETTAAALKAGRAASEKR